MYTSFLTCCWLAEHTTLMLSAVCRKYALDYIALLLMVIFLVMSEETVPFTRYIYHIDDQASHLQASLSYFASPLLHKASLSSRKAAC